MPSDTQLRSILDPVKPSELRPAFRAIHSGLQRSHSLSQFTYFGDKLLLAIDGTGTYASTNVSCQQCCIKKAKTTQKEGDGPEFYHPLLAAVIVHPDKKTVLPLDFELITRHDGSTKNDCERNAAKRLLPSIAAQYSKRRFIVIEDALAANGPHLKTLTEQSMDYIIVAKPGGNATLFNTLNERLESGLTTAWETVDEDTGLTRGYRISAQVPLNNTHPDLLVNSLDYWEVDTKGKQRHWHWISNLNITRDNAFELMRAGRARWKIENETFQALKKHGYHFEHS